MHDPYLIPSPPDFYLPQPPEAAGWSNIVHPQYLWSRFPGMPFNSEYHGERRAMNMSGYCQSIVVKDPTVVTMKDSISIPPDVILEILRRLPVKSVLRFRLVCKLWHSLTQEHHFISQHLRNTPNPNDLGIITLYFPNPCLNHGLSIHHYVNGFHKFDMMSVYSGRNYKMSAPCDGMVCVYGSETTLVVNPSIREVLILPKTKNKAHASVALVKTTSTGEYKVVRLFRNGAKKRVDSTGCEIFNLGSHSWRIVLDPPPIDMLVRPTVVNGAVHWVASDFSYSTEFVVSFDIENETFGTIKAPVGFIMSRGTVLTEWEGHLCLFVRPGTQAVSIPGYKDIRIWVLEDYGNLRWKRHHFNMRWRMDPVMIRDGKMLLQCRYSKYHCYDLKSGTFMTLQIATHEHGYSILAYPYKESLVSPIAIQEKNAPGGVPPWERKSQRGMGTMSVLQL